MARLLITAGPTREPIDPVRFISNASTGQQGTALAAEALARGHQVDLVCGPMEAPPPPGANVVHITTARQMLEACLERHPACDILIGAAAVSDYRPRESLERKHKRGGGPWILELVPNEDILATLARTKGRRVHAGFALETEGLLENGLQKLREKHLDWLVANEPAAIGAPGARYLLLGADGTRNDLGPLSKRDLSRALLDRLESTLAGRAGRD